MPFERRSDVQVLEDDGSEKLLRRTAANRAFSTLFKAKNTAAKPVQRPQERENEKRRVLLVFRDLLQCLDRFLGRLRHFGIAATAGEDGSQIAVERCQHASDLQQHAQFKACQQR